ncbi:MAG: acyl carrier protein [Syntrophomonadaceae bacterium]|nr:acyl carrier protein [Syntrophomonadaceae bacterium]
MSVFEVVRQVIVEIKDIPEEIITMEAKFEEDLEADSLDVVEMLMLLEEKYEITIPEEAAEEMKTVGDAVDYIEARLAEKE